VRFLLAAALVVVGAWAGYMWFESDLGLALCDSGDCRSDDARDEIYQGIAIVCLVAVVGIGVITLRQRRSRRRTD
jgi:hypothetical protein